MTPLDVLLKQERFSDFDIVRLLSLTDPADIERLRRAAFDLATETVGDAVHLRGLVEVSNICRQDCNYCGIRHGNAEIERYSLDRKTVVESALWCAAAGFGSCVLQAGERRDPAYVRFIADCVAEIRRRSVSEALPDGLGITLSLGEQTAATYHRWRDAGAHRYLLRIETTNRTLFSQIHPPSQRFEARLRALDDLRSAGFQVGTGVMIGLPGQSIADLAADIRFFLEHDIDMIGMGPYIRAAGNAMPDDAMMDGAGLLEQALKMIAVTRLVLRDVNIASTTALEVLAPDGRERGIAFGANVAMPNVTPQPVRRNYQLYAGKPRLDDDPATAGKDLESRLRPLGRRVGIDAWGDSPHYARRTGSLDAQTDDGA